MDIYEVYSPATTKNGVVKKIQEDGRFAQLPFLAVVDGVSAPYNLDHPPRLFNNHTGMNPFDAQSGGEMVRDTILRHFCAAPKVFSLPEILLSANMTVRGIQKDISPDSSDQLAGASFAAAKIEKFLIRLLQVGDCFAVWLTADGKIGFLKNQTALHEKEALAIIDELLLKNGGDQDAMWLDFYDPLCQLRRRDVNQRIKSGYALLNGQRQFYQYWQEAVIPRQGLRVLMLFTDGFIPTFLDSGDEKAVARYMLSNYTKAGLEYILSEVRHSEKTNPRGYTDHCEATAIAVTFPPIA